MSKLYLGRRVVFKAKVMYKYNMCSGVGRGNSPVKCYLRLLNSAKSKVVTLKSNTKKYSVLFTLD